MRLEDLQPILHWCLKSALAEAEPIIKRFVKDNCRELLRLKDHQWHALLREAVRASAVQSIQKFLHEQGTRSTRQEWRLPVRLTFADQDRSEPLWFALIKLLNWLQEEGSPPQQCIVALQRGLATICYDAGVNVDVALSPGTITLELVRVVVNRLVATVEKERVEQEEEVTVL